MPDNYIVINSLRELRDRGSDRQCDAEQLTDRLQRSALMGLWKEQDSGYEMRLLHSHLQ